MRARIERPTRAQALTALVSAHDHFQKGHIVQAVEAYSLCAANYSTRQEMLVADYSLPLLLTNVIASIAHVGLANCSEIYSDETESIM